MHSWDCDGEGFNCEFCRDTDKIRRGWRPPGWWNPEDAEAERQRLEDFKRDNQSPNTGYQR